MNIYAGPHMYGVGRVVTGVIKITLEICVSISKCQSALLYLPLNQRKAHPWIFMMNTMKQI